MGEDIGFGPAGKVEQGAMGQEVEAALGKLHPILALKPEVEPCVWARPATAVETISAMAINRLRDMDII